MRTIGAGVSMKHENRYIVIKRKDLAPNVPLDTLEEFEEVFSKVSPPTSSSRVRCRGKRLARI